MNIPQTFGELLDYALETMLNPEERILFRMADEEIAVSYAEFYRNVNRMCNLLLDLGVKKGDHIAVFLPNCLEYPHLFPALAKLGAAMSPINPFLRGEPLKFIINNSDAKYLITSHELFLDKITYVIDSLEKIEKILFTDKQVQTSKLETTLFSKFKERSSEFEPPWRVSGSDIQGIWYTAGTTGLPKGSVIEHICYIQRNMFFKEYFRLSHHDVIYYVLPMYHVAYPVWGLPLAMAATCEIVNVKWFSASKFWEHMVKYRGTLTFTTGTIIPIMLSQPITPTETQGASQLKVWVGWPIDNPEVVKKRWPNINFIEGYGTTEYHVAAICSYDDPELGSAGPPTPYTDLKILDPETGKDLPRGAVGEIVVKHKLGPSFMMKEYYKDPEKTKRTLRNGWWYSGDLGYIDARGCLHFADRIKDYLRVAGENVASMQVEQVIQRHPKIKEAAVVGVRGELGHDEIIAHVILKEGKTLLPREFFEFCNQNMAYFMVPRYLVIRNELPKTATLRVEKYKLREEEVPPSSFDRVKLGIKLRR